MSLVFVPHGNDYKMINVVCLKSQNVLGEYIYASSALFSLNECLFNALQPILQYTFPTDAHVFNSGFEFNFPYLTAVLSN